MNVLQVRALCARAMTADRIGKASFDISVRQLAVLCELRASDEPGTVRGLFAALGVPAKGSITRACDSLVTAGLISRIRDPHDGRNVLISLTEKGKAFLNSLASEEGRVAA